MRTITRTGVTLSVVAALALYGLQLVGGLMVTVGIVAIGVIAGLSVAKWLERDWYGRQLDAGARAGAIACGVAGLSALFYLLGQGPRSIADLSARSTLLGASMDPVIQLLSPLGPVGVDITASVVATLLGITLAAFTARVFGWGKDKRSLKIIAQARLAAQAQQQGELGAQLALDGGRPSSPSVQLYGRTGAPALQRPTGQESASGAGVSPLTFESWGDTSELPAATLQAPAAKPKLPKPRKVSNARSADEAITEDERAALLAWETALADESQSGMSNRAPKASEFLTQPSVAPKRNRKKQNTRDWLC